MEAIRIDAVKTFTNARFLPQADLPIESARARVGFVPRDIRPNTEVDVPGRAAAVQGERG